MDVEDTSISSVRQNSAGDALLVYGSNFTRYTRIYVNGQKVPTTYLNASMLSTDLGNVEDGDLITVNIIGSKSILLRAGVGEVVYEDPNIDDTEEPMEDSGE
jgi:hypothetical protein